MTRFGFEIPIREFQEFENEADMCERLWNRATWAARACGIIGLCELLPDEVHVSWSEELDSLVFSVEVPSEDDLRFMRLLDGVCLER